MKINFTKEHMARLTDLAIIALFNKVNVNTKLGQVLNIYELLHTDTIESLRKILSNIKKLIQTEEDKDEWSSKDVDSKKLERLREDRELVNLAIGYKIKNLEIAANAKKKAELTAKLAELQESTKTPEDRIKEMEAELAKLDEF